MSKFWQYKKRVDGEGVEDFVKDSIAYANSKEAEDLQFIPISGVVSMAVFSSPGGTRKLMEKREEESQRQSPNYLPGSMNHANNKSGIRKGR